MSFYIYVGARCLKMPFLVSLRRAQYTSSSHYLISLVDAYTFLALNWSSTRTSSSPCHCHAFSYRKIEGARTAAEWYIILAGVAEKRRIISRQDLF